MHTSNFSPVRQVIALPGAVMVLGPTSSNDAFKTFKSQQNEKVNAIFDYYGKKYGFDRMERRPL